MRFLLFLLFPLLNAEIAYYGIHPKGSNPTLYSQEDDVIQLDESTFNDTIFCTGPQCTAYLVEFYSDWCGHCRAFAPLYKSFAKDVKAWSNVVRVAAMNCADSANEETCRANGVLYFPFIKYFPRNATDEVAGSKLRPYQSVSEMRDQLTKVVMDDWSVNRFDDWPNFDYLGDVLTYGELWEGTPPAAEHLSIIFESHQQSLTGAQLLLDLQQHKSSLVARRCLRNHPLTDALHINDFPSLVIFQKGEKKPVLIAELRRLLLSEIENFLQIPSKNRVPLHFGSRKNKTASLDCKKEPEKCRGLYYVSEVDMLKAMRYAIYRETARTGSPLQGANLTALHEFVGLLADHFPVVTEYAGANETHLDRSNRAVRVFSRLRNFIEKRGLESSISVDDWKKEFEAAEEAAGHPFPIVADWDHCKGSTGQFRGYTCGLWTTFHTLTVSTYKQALSTNQLSELHPLPALQAIRDWVGNFFGCKHCREHFLRMTTNTFKMEAQARTPEDVFMYLWRAHNIVNARLKGRDTEDPKFPKYQFPARFLCTNCTQNGIPADSETKQFLLNFYSSIKPFPVDQQNSLTKDFSLSRLFL